MNAEKIFLDYASAFDPDNNKIAIKIRHTLMTVRAMDQLTGLLGLDKKMRELAHYCAVFHDIGRFEQVRQFNTFRDEISADHADLGCRVLCDHKILAELSEKDRQKVLTAVRNHNKYRIEEGTDEETLALCHLIRDADKIDILRVFAEEDPIDTMGESCETVAKERISEEVFSRIMSHREIPKAIRRSGLDRWVGFLGFIYGAFYRESLQIIKEQGFYAKRFKETVFLLPDTAGQVREILNGISAYLNSVC